MEFEKDDIERQDSSLTKPLTYLFLDHVFDNDVDNKTIFMKLALLIVEDVLKAINGKTLYYNTKCY